MKKLVFLVSFLLLVSCGPKVVQGPGGDIGKVTTIALLPPKADGDIARERVAYVQSVLREELADRGFIILEQKITDAVCPDAQCAARETLRSKYPVDAFAQLELQSVVRANFVLGNYSSIGGALELTAPNGAQILQVSHTERERGGFLFNTGQVLQGLKSTVENYGDAKFAELANEFTKKIAGQIPMQNAAKRTEPARIDSVHITPIGSESRYKVCVMGSPNAAVGQIVIGSRKGGLHEAVPGTYCSVFPLGWLVSNETVARAELRSAFGEAASKDLTTTRIGVCDPKSAVSFANASLIRSCSGPSCQGGSAQCGNAKFLVFTAAQESGPYKRAAELKPQAPWKDAANNNPTYAVVALSPDGAASMPALFGNISVQ